MPTDLPTNVCRDSEMSRFSVRPSLPDIGLGHRDKDLLALREFQGIAIIKPGEFWRRTTG